MKTLSFQRDKMRELVLYIAKKQEDDPSFGRVKLAKLLYFSDNEAFLRLGDPVTCANYQKLPQGPGAREFLSIKDELMTSGSASETAMDWPNGQTSVRLVAKRNADMSMFSDKEVDVIDGVLEKYRGVSGTAISKLSHDEIGWKVANYGDTIPYTAYLLSPAITDRQREFALSKAKSLVLA